jgi:putative membrane protein
MPVSRGCTQLIGQARVLSAGVLEAANGAAMVRGLVMTRCVLSLLFALLFGTGVGTMAVGTAFAADLPAGPPTNQAANQAPAATPPSTERFAASVAAGSQFEIASSKLALVRAGSAAVKDFADRMVDDYTTAAADFKVAVSRAKLPPPPEKLDARHQAMLDDLKTRDAASFDKAYVDAQVQALREIVDLFRTYATVGDNARIKRFAQDLLLTMRSNLDDASKLR